MLLALLAALCQATPVQAALKGEAEAIAEANAMVETLGGREIWSQLESVHFVHRWFFWNRVDSYLENEILDLTGPRSWVEMKSEIYHRLRAYSPEHKYWNVVNGEFAMASDEQFAATQERAPYHWCRIARAVAIGDASYEVSLAAGPFPGSRQIEFYGSDGERHGWIVLNARKEPILWATTQYQYVFGPLKQFGNLRAPNWAITGNGAVMYEMVSLTGDRTAPPAELFVPPALPGGR